MIFLKKSSHPGHNVAPCTKRSWGSCLNHTTIWLNSTQSGSWKDGASIKNLRLRCNIPLSNSSNLLEMAKPLLGRANLTCFCSIGYMLKAASITFLFRDFSSQNLQQKHGFKALCHVGYFLPDHKFCYIIQQLEQNMFLQGCGKYLDGSSKQFHFSSYMTYVNTTKEHIRVGDNHGPLSTDWQSQSTKATLLLLYPVCYIAKPRQT